MSDDEAAQPPSNFYGKLIHRSFGKLTHFIDENIRIIQYGIYGVGAVGVLLVLHSARAFTKFGHIQDIPKEFITKHVRLHGEVRWVGTSPPVSKTPSDIPPLSLPAGDNIANFSAPLAPSTPPGEEVGSESTHSSTKENSKTTVVKPNAPVDTRSISQDNRGIYDGAGELHPWENNIDPDVDRIEYDEELCTVCLQVEHTPVISLFKRNTNQLLPLQLAGIEACKAGVQQARCELLGRKAWFTLVSHNPDDDILVTFIKPTKLFQRRTFNEQLVRNGLALTGPMDLDLYGDRYYFKQYKRLLKAQDYAEKKKIGMWKPPPKPAGVGGLIGRLVAKMKSLLKKN